MRPILGLCATAIAACTAEPPDPGPPSCDAGCEGPEVESRWNNPDWLVRASGTGLFYEDFGATVPPDPLCGVGPKSQGPVQLLWRRTLGTKPVRRASDGELNWDWGTSNLAVSSGRAILNVDSLIVEFAAATGEIQHIWDAPRGGADYAVGPDCYTPIAGLDRRGRYAYMSHGHVPAVVDLDTTYLNQGPKVMWSWFEDVLRKSDPGLTIDLWSLPAPTIAPDGTLIWKSGAGPIRAVTVDGRLRWQRFYRAGGWGLVDEEGTSYWRGQPPVALRLADGSPKWRAAMPPGLRGSDPAVGLEIQGAGVFRYWPLRWVQQSETGGTIAEFLAAHSLNDGSVLWSRPYDERLLGPSTGASSAQGVDGVLYVASMDYSGNIPGYQGPRLTKAGRLAAVSPRDGSILWHTWMPVPDGFTSASLTGIVGGPVASRKHRGVYVASLNCKVYFFDGEGQIRWWYRLDGQPLGQLPQLVDGILYVLTEVPHGVPEDQEVCCGSPDVYRARYRYDCDHTLFDHPCIQGWWKGVYQLYAFRAE